MLQHLKGYQRSITPIKTGRLNKKTTQILIHQKRGKRQEQKLKSACAIQVQVQIQVHIQSIVSPVYIHPGFLLQWVTQINNFNIFRKDWDAVLPALNQVVLYS